MARKYKTIPLLRRDGAPPLKGTMKMITIDKKKTVTVEIPSVFTYTDNDFKDAKGKPVEYRIDLATVKDPNAVVVRGLRYGWNRSLNDSKGSSEAKTEDARRESQSTRYDKIMSNTWSIGGGGGAKADPVLVQVRSIIATKTRKPIAKVVKRFKTLAEVREAYGDTATDMWIETAKQAIELLGSAGDADDDLPDVFDDD